MTAVGGMSAELSQYFSAAVRAAYLEEDAVLTW
jgi:hypothetical protein